MTDLRKWLQASRTPRRLVVLFVLLESLAFQKGSMRVTAESEVPDNVAGQLLRQTVKAAAASSPSRDSLDGATASGLVWSDLSVVSSNRDVTLLHPFSGWITSGQIGGILGPSGSGKSTFLSALSGSSRQLYQTGQVWHYLHTVVHGSKDTQTPIQLSRIPTQEVAWLQQHDDFFSMLTVRETLDLAAYLELPHLVLSQRDALVQTHLDALGLAHAADRPIGSDLTGLGTARLSGGERRRLSVALELLTEKQLLLADEPTSGLDSSISVKVMQNIRDVCRKRNIPCLCAIHQPRSSIWHLLDTLILMAPGGRVVYAGPKSEAVAYFATQGYRCPDATNPAEYFVDLVSVDTEDEQVAAIDEARIDKLASVFRDYQQTSLLLPAKRPQVNLSLDIETDIQQPSNGQSMRRAFQEKSQLGLLKFLWVPRLGALLQRSWRQNVRNWEINIFRAVASAGNAILLAQIFPTVRGSVAKANSVADRVALLSFGAINMCFIAFMKTVTLIAEEKPVVQREQSRRQYSSLEYLVAKVLAEFPLDSLFSAIFTAFLKKCSGVRISWAKLTGVFSLLTVSGASLGLMLGSWLPTEKLATTGSIPVLVVLMVVGIINPSGVDQSTPPPAVVQVLKRCSPFAYAIEALCLGEYPGMEFERQSGWFGRIRDLPRMGGLAMVRNGDQVLEALGLQDKGYVRVMQHLGVLSAAYLAVSWLGMLVQGRKHGMHGAVEADSSQHVQRTKAPKDTEGSFPSKSTTETSISQRHLKVPLKIRV